MIGRTSRRLRRRILLAPLAAALATNGARPSAAQAQSAYPSRSIRMVVPFPPAGATDILGFLLLAQSSEILF